MSMDKFLPPPDTFVQLEPEELAVPLLKYLIHEEEGGHHQSLNLHNFLNGFPTEGYSKDQKKEALKAITEAWLWLGREGMCAPQPGQDSRNWVYVTKRGKELSAYPDMAKYIKSNVIPKRSLDTVLASKVMNLFIRGDYDTAVFQAFKEVEIRVRTRCSLPQELVGIELMRTAFNPENGKLTDMSRPKAEREATSHLFAGAIGLFKNPSSHRDMNWSDPVECAELIYLANNLLRIVDKHAEHNNN